MATFPSRICVYQPRDAIALIVDVNESLLGHADIDECALMLGTMAVESAFQFREQLGGGPARGIFQMEPATAQDIFEHYLQYHMDHFQGLLNTWFNLSFQAYFIPTIPELDYHLSTNDVFACAMARLQYVRFPEPIPDSISGYARYWKKYYNTPEGAGTLERFRDAWRVHKCSDLLRLVFPDHQLNEGL